MVAFNPDNRSNEPTNWTGRSQGLPANRAFEVAAEGIANTVEGVAKAKDFQIQQDIRQDVEDVFAGTNKAFGLDEEAGFGAAGSQDEVPTEFKSAGKDFRERLGKTIAARDQGRLSDAHYQSMLAYSMKNIKAKYPGYHEIIDSIYANVTGEHPAIALRNSLEQQYAAEKRKSDDSADDLKKAIDKYSDIIAAPNMFPDFFTNPEKYRGREEEVLAKARQESARREMVKAEDSQLSLEAKQGNMNNAQAKKTYGTRVTQIVDEKMQGALNMVIGPNGEKFNDVISRASSGKISPEEAQQLTAFVGNLKYNTQLAIQQLSTNEWVVGMDTADRRQVEEDALKRLDLIEQAVNSEQYGAILVHERANKFLKERNLSVLRKEFGEIQALEAMIDVLGPAAPEWFLRTGGGSALTDSITPSAVVQTLTGKMNMTGVIGAINSEDLTGEQKGQAVSDYLRTMKSAFLDDSTTPDVVANAVISNFGGTNPAIDDVFKNAEKSNHMEIYTFWTDPRVVDKLVASGNGQAIAFYNAWAKDKLDDIPEISTMLANIADQQRSGQRNANFDIMYDPNTKQLQAVPKISPEEAKQRAIDQMGNVPSVPGDIMLMKGIERENQRLAPINRALKNMVYALDKSSQFTGIDGTAAVQEVMQNNGIVITLGEDKGGDASGSVDPFLP